MVIIPRVERPLERLPANSACGVQGEESGSSLIPTGQIQGGSCSWSARMNTDGFYTTSCPLVDGWVWLPLILQ